MPSASWPVERIGLMVFASLSFFTVLKFVLTKFLMKMLWGGYEKLDQKMQRALVMRIVSSIHSVISTYNSYCCLVDPHLRANILENVNDTHFSSVCFLSGYFVYDTLAALSNWAAEDEAAGACQTMIHHVFVLGTIPIGLITNTFAWMGAALAFYTEISGVPLNLIWIFRTVGLQDHWIYIANALLFSVTFTICRTVVLGYYTYVTAAVVYAHYSATEAGPITMYFPTLGEQTFSGEMNCSNIVPRLSIGGSCQFALWLQLGIWVVSLVWVPAVFKKLKRAVATYLKGGKQMEEEKKAKKSD